MQVHKVMVFECDYIFIENEPLEIDNELNLMLDQLDYHEMLVIESVSSFGKLVGELDNVLGLLFEKSIHLISVEDELDSNNMCSFYELSSLIFRINKECSSQIVKERISLSREKDLRFGRPPIDEDKIEKIKRLYCSNKLPMRKIAEICEVLLGTVHKYLTEQVEQKV